MSNITHFLKILENYEVACLSACRSTYCNVTEHTLDDRPSPDSGQYRYTEDDNKRRTRDLSVALLKLGYGLIKVDRTTYTERDGSDEAVEVAETSLIVFNINDEHDFYANIFHLSELYNQDCFLYKEKGSNRRYIIGTNKADYPGYGNKVETRWVHKNIIDEFRKKISAVSKNDYGSTDCCEELIDALGLKTNTNKL